MVTVDEMVDGYPLLRHNKTHVGVSHTFVNLGPDTRYNVTITPLAYDNSPIERVTAVSSVLTSLLIFA